MVNGEYKVFDLLCNETHDSQVHSRIEGKWIRVIEECLVFELLCNRTHDSELWISIEGKERMIKNYIYESRELLYSQVSMIVVLWLAFDYLVVAELAYNSRMFRRLLMDEGEFGPGFFKVV